jgi:predicted RNA binding protein YcfA (HicA-like mRNA interferase family)
MSPKNLPTISGQEAIRALIRLGFTLDRIRVSHHILRHEGPPVRAISVPVHGSRPLPKGTLQAIVKKSGFTTEEFVSKL